MNDRLKAAVKNFEKAIENAKGAAECIHIAGIALHEMLHDLEAANRELLRARKESVDVVAGTGLKEPEEAQYINQEPQVNFELPDLVADTGD